MSTCCTAHKQSLITIKPEHRISIFFLIGVLLDYLEEMYFSAIIMIRIE